LNGKQPNPIFFLDRTHGKITRNLLARVGFSVVLHSHYFPPEEKDTVWLAKCGKENWIVLSGDKAIERVPENRQAVIDAKCKVLFFNDSNSRGEEWAAAVIVGRARLLEIIERNNGPLFVTIEKYARSHISPVRYAGDGGPKPAEDTAKRQIAGGEATAPPDPQPRLAQRIPEQRELFRKKSDI
jgi:hypothetical protein